MFFVKIYVRKHPLILVPKFSSWNSFSLLNDRQALLKISASLCCYSYNLDRATTVPLDSFALPSGETSTGLYTLKQIIFGLRQS